MTMYFGEQAVRENALPSMSVLDTLYKPLPYKSTIVCYHCKHV